MDHVSGQKHKSIALGSRDDKKHENARRMFTDNWKGFLEDANVTDEDIDKVINVISKVFVKQWATINK